MGINSAGDVGIGTQMPIAKLHIIGYRHGDFAKEEKNDYMPDFLKALGEMAWQTYVRKQMGRNRSVRLFGDELLHPLKGKS
jgi:hypothetical protein